MPLAARTEGDTDAVPLHLLDPDALTGWLAGQSDAVRAWVALRGFKAGIGETCLLPGPEGTLAGVLVGWGDGAARGRDRFHLARVRADLPAGRYALAEDGIAADLGQEALGWLLSEYRFERYRTPKEVEPRILVVQPDVAPDRLSAIAAAECFGRDLIDTPARDMGPEALEAAATALAEAQGARISVIRGVAALADANFPMIAAVGAAAAQAPRLIDFIWGREDAPKVTLVGKGVCFDTGGLNIKPGASMGLMKKDMGGAATTLALARMIMELGLDLRLRVLIPAVENSISAPAMRPGDILTSRKGLSVEVNNTDAEGRLVLADALALGDEEAPDLMVSLATLTGAARVALGPDLPPFFTDDDALAAALAVSAERVADPLWRLPFWNPYEPLIEPGIADLDNAPSGGMAGAITAALFLRRFTGAARAYVHVDLYGWTPVAKSGRPKGGACQGARALLDLLETRPCRPI